MTRTICAWVFLATVVAGCAGDRACGCSDELPPLVTNCEIRVNAKLTGKKAFYYCDDVIWLFRDLTRQRPKSLFDNPFLAILKEAHDKYGMKAQLNCFYRLDFFYGTDEFSLAEMTDAYRAEWQANKDWLKLGLHSLQEFPDYPFINADYKDMKTVVDRISGEIDRFAGPGVFAKGAVVHWGMISKDACRALKDSGIVMLCSHCGPRHAYTGDPSVLPYGHAMRLEQNRKPETCLYRRLSEDKAISSSIGGYNNLTYAQAREIYGNFKYVYDRETGIGMKELEDFQPLAAGINLYTLATLLPAAEKYLDNAFFVWGNHEQYFHRDYLAYQPEYAAKILSLAKLLRERGYEHFFLEDLATSEGEPLPARYGSTTVVAPMDDYHSPTNRRFTGIPSVAVSQKTGRLWMTYYASCTDGEDSNNYSVLATSVDNGESWKEVLVADPDGKGPVRSFDPEVWIGPDNRLRWTWSERVTPVRDGEKNRFLDGGKELKQDDRIWMVELDPDKVDLSPVAAREIGRGIMMCKPIVTKDGRWLFPNAHWGAAPSACVLESRDAAKTFRELGGVTLPEKIREYDEHNLVELKNGNIRAYMRTNAKGGHATWQAESSDGGVTWGEPKACGFKQLSSRIFVRRLMDGRLLLVKNGGLDEKLDKREKMMAFVSDDDGRTWRGGLMLWENFYCSYPDGDQGADGTIYLVFDGNRFGENRKMYFVRFTVDDVLSGKPVSSQYRLVKLHEIFAQNR